MPEKPLYHLVSLGCAKNRVDSENIMGLLKAEGYGYTPEPSDAEVIIVNTCSFISPARKESVEEILQMAEYKKGKCRALVVAGCMPAHCGRQLFREIPQVDALVTPANLHRIPSLIEGCLAGRRAAYLEAGPAPAGELPRQVTGSPHSVYLKIAEGCSHRCGFCIIPRLRGPYVSRPLEALVAEAGELAAAGARELNLVAQDTTFYGLDIYRGKKLPELLHRLAAIPRLEWIRVLYAHPLHLDAGLLDTMREEEKVCSYLDLPLQHTSAKILKMMGRGGFADPGNLVRMCREKVPGLVLRSTFIVGFPGERSGHFEELLGFLQEHRIERAGVFPYSREEGTPAAAYSRQVPERVKQSRYRRAMLLLKRVSLTANRELLGQTLTVMVDGPSPQGSWLGRFYGQAPEVDGRVSFTSDTALRPGDLVRVRITRSLEYDLEGVVCR